MENEIFLFDLMGISHRIDQNLVPGTWSNGETNQILSYISPVCPASGSMSARVRMRARGGAKKATPRAWFSRDVSELGCRPAGAARNRRDGAWSRHQQRRPR